MHFRNQTFHLVGFPAGRISAWIVFVLVWVWASSISSSGAQLTLNWSDNSNNESGFKIERSTDGQSFSQVATVGANIGTYSNTGLAESTRYYYRVRAYNGAGNSGYTNVSNAVTSGVPPPPPPSGNTAPTITLIAGQTISEDGSTGAIGFKVTDLESTNASLTLSATSSNTTLIPVGRIAFGGASTNRTVTVTPAANRSGVASLTVTVSDGQLTASRTFQVTVNPVNDRPSIGAIGDRTISEGSSTGPIAFTVSDVETSSGSLILTRTSSNTGLIALSGIVFGGSGANRTVTVAPVSGQSGVASVTITVSDGQLSRSRSFTVTVELGSEPPPPPPSGSTAPTITLIAGQTISEDGSTGAIGFKVTDLESTNASLTLSATSSNTTLIPVGRIAFGGASTNRTVTVTPAANRSGVASLTVMVSDGQLTASRTFQVTVNPVNDRPTVSNIPNRTIDQGRDTGPIGFSVGDPETPGGSLIITVDSSNRTLAPLSVIALGGSDKNRSISVTPVPTRSGEATITVRVSDGQLATSDSFRLTVNPVDGVAVSLSTPVDGAQFTVGSSINLTALVSDVARTSRVEFFSGGAKLGQDSSHPFAYTWANPGEGDHSLKARVVETSGIKRDSAPVAVTVSEEALLSVSMVSPSADESIVLGESMVLEAVVTGIASAIKRVDFFVNSTRIKQEFSAPYTAPWTPDGPGAYALRARVISNTNTKTDSVVRTVTVARPAITVSLISPEDQTVYAYGEPIAMEAIVSDIAETARVDFLEGNSLIESKDYSPYTFDWSPLSGGVRQIRARVHDTSGNIRYSGTAKITVESAAETRVVLESPEEGASFTLGQTVSLRASVDAFGTSVVRVEFFQGSTKLGQDLKAPFALDWVASPVGEQNLRARAVTADGLKPDSQTVKVLVGTAPLIVTLTAPVDGQRFERGESVGLIASVSDVSRTERVEFYSEGIKLGDDTSVPYRLGWTPPESGSHDIYARVIEAGGGTWDSAIVVVTIEDAVPLQVTMESPLDGFIVRIGESVNVSALIDVSGEYVSRVDFYAGSERIKTEWQAPYAFNWTPVEPGETVIRARARNLTGTRYHSDRVTLVVKHPVVMGGVKAPVDGAVFGFGQNVNIEATVSDSDRVDRVEFLIDGDIVSEDFEAPFLFTWSDPEPGVHGISVRTVDVDGDSFTSEPLAITIEDPALTIELTRPANGSRILKGEALTIEVTASDTDRTSKVEFLVDGEVVAEVMEAPYSVAWIGDEEGVHTIHARAYDLDGNASMSKRAVIAVDPQPGLMAGVYRGVFSEAESGVVTGAFAVYLPLDGSVVFMGYDEASGTGFLSDALSLTDDGGFEVVGEGPAGRALLTAQHGQDAVTGQVGELGLVVNGSWVADSDSSALYRLVGIRSIDTEIFVINGPGERAFVGSRQGGLFRGHEVVSLPTSVGIDVSSKWLGLEISLDFGEGIARGFMEVPGGGFWVSGLRDDVPVIRRLENLSTRGFINPGSSVMIVGFVTAGSGPKQVLIRGVGPGLSGFGVSSAMRDPTLLLRSGSEVIGTNQRWFTPAIGQAIEEVSALVGAFPLEKNSADAALFLEVPPGIFTAVVRDGLNLGGDTLVEIYDTDEATPILADLKSLSTRGPVGAGKNLIGGFVISGNMPKRVLIRGVGPALEGFGIPDALESARLVLTRRVAGDDVTIGDNLGWSSNSKAGLIAAIGGAVGAFPLEQDSLDSALLLWLEPGVYTFVVQPGVAGLSGTALVEVYSVE